MGWRDDVESGALGPGAEALMQRMDQVLQEPESYYCYLLVNGCTKRGVTICSPGTLEQTKRFLNTLRPRGMRARLVVEPAFREE